MRGKLMPPGVLYFFFKSIFRTAIYTYILYGVDHNDDDDDDDDDDDNNNNNKYNDNTH